MEYEPSFFRYTEKDKQIGKDWLENNKLPPNVQSRRDTDNFNRKWDSVVIKEDGTFWKGDRQIIFPHEKEELLIELYDDPVLGHKGVNGFWSTLKHRYINITFRDVQKLLSRLEKHQVHRAFHNKQIVKPIVSSGPFKHFQADLISLPKYNNFEYVLNIVDIFTKYLWSYPLKKKEASVVAKELEKFFEDLPRGISFVIQSDNGGEFLGSFSDYVKKVNDDPEIDLKVKQIFSTSHTPQTQGQIERLNGTLKNRLSRLMTSQDSKNWVELLPLAVENYNCTVHRVIRFRPKDARFQAEQLQNTIRKNLKQNTKAFKDNYNDKFPNLEVGDLVRLSRLSEAQIRRRQADVGHYYDKNGQWSKAIYEVGTISKGDKLTNTEMYKMKGYLKYWPRHMLLKIPKDTIKQKEKEVKEKAKPVPKGKQLPPRRLQPRRGERVDYNKLAKGN